MNAGDVIPIDANGDFELVEFPHDPNEVPPPADVDLTGDDNADLGGNNQLENANAAEADDGRGAAEDVGTNAAIDGDANVDVPANVANETVVPVVGDQRPQQEQPQQQNQQQQQQEAGSVENGGSSQPTAVLQQGVEDSRQALRTASKTVQEVEGRLAAERRLMNGQEQTLDEAREILTAAEQRAIDANNQVSIGEEDLQRAYRGQGGGQERLARILTRVQDLKKEAKRAENAVVAALGDVTSAEHMLQNATQMVGGTKTELDEAKAKEEQAGAVFYQRAKQLAVAQRCLAEAAQRASEAETAQLMKRAKDRLDRTRQERGITVGPDNRLRNLEGHLCNEEAEALFPYRRGNHWNGDVAVDEEGNPLSEDEFRRNRALYRNGRGIQGTTEAGFINSEGVVCDEDGEPLVETLNKDGDNDNVEENGG
jgi:hypothetical protein